MKAIQVQNPTRDYDALLQLADDGWPLTCTVLKVPHHGSAAGMTEGLLAATQPALAVISVGADNRFGHPASSTLQLLEQQSIATLRTDQAGDIEVIVDDSAIWRAETERIRMKGDELKG